MVPWEEQTESRPIGNVRTMDAGGGGAINVRDADGGPVMAGSVDRILILYAFPEIVMEGSVVKIVSDVVAEIESNNIGLLKEPAESDNWAMNLFPTL